ncbi:MAG: hypothetical protein KAX40_05880 [Herpetosiphon sp.]|nr:hypothetical protein [Herpetosiphon sp.]
MTTAIATMTTMLEQLPETTRHQVVDYVRHYLAELDDEVRWEQTFQQTQPQLIAAARRARQEIAEGKSKPMDYDQL